MLLNHRKHANWKKQSLALVYGPTQVLVQLTLTTSLNWIIRERAIAFGFKKQAEPNIPNAQGEQLGHPS